ncbi:MAG: flavodoxin family protein [bacterium]|nr:flavodoxin family protein [bacterium]
MALNGSARVGGNTDILIDEMLLGAKVAGAETKKIYLPELHIKPCTGCLHCKSNEVCIIDDDHAHILSEMFGYTAIIIGSPVYMGQVTGQTKLFLDRLYSLRRADRSLKKDGAHIRGAVIATCGSPSSEHPQPSVATMKILFRFLNSNLVHELTGTSLGPKGQAKERHGLLDEARELGRRLVE